MGTLMTILALIVGLVMSFAVGGAFFLAAQHNAGGDRKDGQPLKDKSKHVYQQFHEIISTHHSEEIKKLLRDVGLNLGAKAEDAKFRQIPLAECDPAFHAQVSDLTGYYESLGLLLRDYWDKFPVETRETMKELLHGDVIRDWEETEKYKQQIHAEPAQVSSPGFQWLYEVMKGYREEKS